MRVCKIFEWDAAHKLVLPYRSPCNELHGHTYKVEIELEGPINDIGMVIDFKELKEMINNKKVSFDHSYLNNVLPQPTAENTVQYLKKMLDLYYGTEFTKKGIKLKRIRVWEAPTSYAEEEW
jgi:6-pyruvoyltetrahydropterin/6-carboxytetrahydropterin synthase